MNVATAGREEVRAGYERDADPLGTGKQLAGVDRVRQVEPDEVPTLGAARLGVGELSVERLQHRIAAHSEQLGHARDIGVEAAAPDELMDGRLADQGRRDRTRIRGMQNAGAEGCGGSRNDSTKTVKPRMNTDRHR